MVRTPIIPPATRLLCVGRRIRGLKIAFEICRFRAALPGNNRLTIELDMKWLCWIAGFVALLLSVLLVLKDESQNGNVIERTLSAPLEKDGGSETLVRSNDHQSAGLRATMEGQLGPNDAVVDESSEDAGPSTVLRGRVETIEGVPVPGLRVFVGGTKWPFEEGRVPSASQDQYRGIFLDTDLLGRFEIQLTRTTGIYVAASPTNSTPYRACETGSKFELEDLEEPVVLCVRAVELGSFVVRVINSLTQERVPSCRVQVIGERLGLYTHSDQNGEVRWSIPIEKDSEVRIRASLSKTGSGSGGATWGYLYPGELTEMVLQVRSNQVVKGFVVSEDGKPIENAFVFFGDLADGRTSKPFKSFKPGRLSGRRTDEFGWFELAGSQEKLTVWHSMFASRTVMLDKVYRIVLSKRGVVTGAVAAESPVLSVQLDDGDSIELDSSGRFEFENVDIGFHGLWVNRRVVGFEMHPAQRIELPIRLESDRLTLSLRGADNVSTEAVLLNKDRPSFVCEIFDFRNGVAELHSLTAGKYLLVLRNGGIQEIALDGNTIVTTGTSAITVRTQPGRRLFVCPEDSDDFIERICARMTARLVGESSEVRFSGLTPGAYKVIERSTGVERVVQAGEGDTRLDF